jgi:alkanesulfonate monooxygenase SsuD/methylene tetrahydromethanopterin reductase-like flavin-dependent oxidoreductase (luciferase family)
MALNAPATPTRVPALDEEPEIVKFVRTDALQYEGNWDPDEYDPESARATFESHIEDAAEAERLGLDGILLTEHHFDGWTLVPSPNVFLAAVAMRTSRLRLGQAVHVLPIHNPWRLAEETGMLDMISNGRAEVGVGKGNFSIERIRYNPPGDDFDERFEEGLELLTRALRESNMTFDGKFNKIPLPATVYPRPFNPDMRVWCAGLRPESIEHIGRTGHNLYGFLTPDASENFKRYVDAAHQAGHERTGANFMTIISLIIAPTDAEAQKHQQHAGEVAWEAMMRRNLPLEEAEFYRPVFGGAIVGSPQTVMDQLGPAFEATGSRRLNLVVRLRGMPEDVARQTQYLFATEIMPSLRHLSVAPV